MPASLGGSPCATLGHREGGYWTHPRVDTQQLSVVGRRDDAEDRARSRDEPQGCGVGEVSCAGMRYG